MTRGQASPIAIALGLAVATSHAAGLAGKYATEWDGMNVTKTRSFVNEAFLVIDAATPAHAWLMVTHNNDVLGEEKALFTIRRHGDVLEFVYDGCTKLATPRDKETPCVDAGPKGDVHYRFRVAPEGLVLIESAKGGLLGVPSTLEKVAKFSFE